MEESPDKHCEAEIVCPDKGKRWLKTPAQLEALENFYNEHKYPSESLKLQFAKQIGLSEKQVSGWFCHRRSKDKRLLQVEVCANEMQNISSGAIFDHTIGLRQESCNSTKQGDWHFDSKEVESKRSYSRKSSSAILSSEEIGLSVHVGRFCSADDRSSRSSSASYGRMLQQNVNPEDVEPAKLSFMDQKYIVPENKGVPRKGLLKVARCSYFEGEIEKPAVSLVKQRLGRLYREDGPLLGIDFDPIPPDAFNSPLREWNHGSYCVGDPIQQRSCSSPLIIMEPKMHDNYRHETASHSLYQKGTNDKRMTSGINHQNEVICGQLASMGPVTKHNDYALNPMLSKDMDDMDEDCGGIASDNNNMKNGKRLKHKVAWGSNNSVDDSFHLYGIRASRDKSLDYSHHSVNYNCKVIQKGHFVAKTSKQTQRSNELLCSEAVMPPRKPFKALREKFYKERRTHGNLNSARSEMFKKSESKMRKNVYGKEFQQQGYLMKGCQDIPWRKSAIRYSGDMAARSSNAESGGITTDEFWLQMDRHYQAKKEARTGELHEHGYHISLQ